MVSKAKLSRIDLGAVFDAVNGTLDFEARPMTHAEFDRLLLGEEVIGYTFAGKAVSKKIAGHDVGMVLVRDVQDNQEVWLGVVHENGSVFSAKRLPALEWKLGQALHSVPGGSDDS